jgi:hypothetical protein
MSNPMRGPDPRPVDRGRRRFWSQLLGKAVVACDELRGHPHMMLDDLARVPDERLAKVVPVFRQDGSFRLEEGRLLSVSADPRQSICVCACSPQETFILARFDGVTTLGQIGQDVAQQFEVPESIGFQQVRELFLRLAREMICHPAGPDV